MSFHELHFNTLANKLTALRIAFVPVVVFFLFRDTPASGFWAAIFFGIAGITDYFDGYFARTHQSVTILGKLLDPLADKFLVVSSLIMLMDLHRIHPSVVIVLILREMAITGLRAIASAEGIIIPASKLAKWKTVTQMAAIPMLMLHETYFSIPFQKLGTIFIWTSLGISVWSAKDYIVDFFRELSKKARERKLTRAQVKYQKRLAKRQDREARRLAKIAKKV